MELKAQNFGICCISTINKSDNFLGGGRGELSSSKDTHLPIYG